MHGGVSPPNLSKRCVTRDTSANYLSVRCIKPPTGRPPFGVPLHDAGAAADQDAGDLPQPPPSPAAFKEAIAEKPSGRFVAVALEPFLDVEIEAVQPMVLSHR